MYRALALLAAMRAQGTWKSAPQGQEFQMRPSFRRSLLVYDFSLRVLETRDLQNEPERKCNPSAICGCEGALWNFLRGARLETLKLVPLPVWREVLQQIRSS